MIKLYYTPFSIYSRPVWMALIEKELPFELVSLKLDGDHLQTDFLAINPFNHVPVLVDDGFKVIESLAILDYLEARYPMPALLPKNSKSLALVRMVEMVTVNELIPAMLAIIRQSKAPEKLAFAKTQVTKVIGFFESLLGDNNYFGRQHISLAELVAGSTIPWLPYLGITLAEYPNLNAWSKRLIERKAWQKTELRAEEVEMFMRRIKILPRVRQRQYRRFYQ